MVRYCGMFSQVVSKLNGNDCSLKFLANQVLTVMSVTVSIASASVILDECQALNFRFCHSQEIEGLQPSCKKRAGIKFRKDTVTVVFFCCHRPMVNMSRTIKAWLSCFSPSIR